MSHAASRSESPSSVAQEIPTDPDLELLDAYLMSDGAPEDSMLLSDLDGFLTGIAIGPELILPSEWLPVVWGGEQPVFADSAEANAVFGAIMGRYNEILRQIEEDCFDPFFWTADDGTVIAADWAEGFLQAIFLRLDAWEKLFKSNRHQHLLFPILALCGDLGGESLLGLDPQDEDWVMEESAGAVPACVTAIAAFWRRKSGKQTSMPFDDPEPPVHFAARKPRRNDPCPCSSGKKFKKCCGASG